MFPVISCQLKKEPMANWNGPIHMLAPGCKSICKNIACNCPWGCLHSCPKSSWRHKLPPNLLLLMESEKKNLCRLRISFKKPEFNQPFPPGDSRDRTSALKLLAHPRHIRHFLPSFSQGKIWKIPCPGPNKSTQAHQLPPRRPQKLSPPPPIHRRGLRPGDLTQKKNTQKSFMRLSLLRAKRNRTWVVGGQQKHKRIFCIACACVDVCDVSWRQTGPRSPRSMAVCVKTMNQHGFTCQLEGAPPGAQKTERCQATFGASDMEAISDFRLYLKMVFAHILTGLAPDPNGPRVVCSHEIDLHTTVIYGDSSTSRCTSGDITGLTQLVNHDIPLCRKCQHHLTRVKPP